ncbi:unnamed protein product [Porites evermanni]|uniref:Beta-galactosidase n=1 Tax=Porites evermanni TaxID=104178 RepID=A0ABN8SEJ7_9CNID|nr:unnamed protein product [Porites evermanni]
MTMNTIHIRSKPVLIILGISAFIILWTAFRVFRGLPMEQRVLRTEKQQFLLEGKPFRILSGAIHYFRVVPEYWKDRLLKLKAMGLNTVETYVPWNLHEEVKGQFNFEGILDIVHFIKLAQSVGLYVIVRPGPYICAEWELGGLPSWLLRDSKMKLRTSYPPYIHAVDKYFKKLLQKLVPLQFSHGGPVIAFQVENEYGSFGADEIDVKYMTHLKTIMIENGISELLFTSDGIRHMEADYFPELPGVLKTANFQRNETAYLNRLKELQPDKPLMVTEFWPGWFDHWGEQHHEMEVEKVVERVSNILKLGASINFYMFHGGTNFGFMNGANAIKGEFKYQPTVTSYDYDAPLSEAGDMTAKFKALKEVLKKYNVEALSPIAVSDHERAEYEDVEMQHVQDLGDLVPLFGPPVESMNVMAMEKLPINNNGGQGYGFILYQTTLKRVPKQITIQHVYDRAQVFLDFKLLHTIDAMDKEKQYIDEKELWEVVIKVADMEAPSELQLDILVENMGRVNFLPDINRQRKGILGDVLIDGQKQGNWRIFPMDFKENFFKKLNEQVEWKKVKEGSLPSIPSLYRGILGITDKPKDSFLYMKGWTKGVVFINGHNLGRYWNLGPQETLYLPAPWLRKGENELLIFELEKCEAPDVSFLKEPKIIGEPVYRW